MPLGYPAADAFSKLLVVDPPWQAFGAYQWELAPSGHLVVDAGTLVLIVGQYDFGRPPPWQNPEQLTRPIDLPIRVE